MKTIHVGSALLFLALASVSHAADVPAQPLGKKGALIFSDDFDRADLGERWRVTTPTFTIADGILRGRQTNPTHGAVGRVELGLKDLLIECRFRLAGARSVNVVCNDRDYKDGHAGHLCRVSLSPRGLMLGDDKERMTRAIEEMKKDPARKAEVARLTAGRTAQVAHFLEANRWYWLAVEIVGDEMRVLLDDQAVGYLKSSGLAHPVKSDFHFTISGGETHFDDVKVWAVEPR